MRGECVRAMKKAASIAVFGFIAIFVSGLNAFAADLEEVRFGPGKAQTRVVFDVMGAPVYSLSGDELGQGRLFIDFKGLSVPTAALAVQPAMGHVASYQFVVNGNDRVRAVLTLKKSSKIKEVFLIEPSAKVSKHRLVVDLASADKTAFLDSIPAQYPDLGPVIEQATAAGAEEVKPAAMQREVAAPPPPPAKKVIVVDAGHGGRDPGSIGQKGTLEKDVTMKAALELKEILEKTGDYNVVLTRNGGRDGRVLRSQRDELARREALARDAGADLFISLHADAIGDKVTRGGSVYTLSDKGSVRSAKIAKSEGNYVVYDLNTAAFGAGVSDILFDLAQGETNKNSNRFADLLIDELAGKTPLLNRSHRTADLRVLLAPDVPAVLYEMAFISNIKDEANLNSPAWRKRAMGSVAKAIDRYFDDEASRIAQRGTAAAN